MRTTLHLISRTFACAFVVLFVMTVSAATALATVVKLGYHSPAQIKASCAKSDSVYMGPSQDAGPNKGSHGCVGTGGTVQCTAKGQCTGVTNARTVPKGLGDKIDPSHILNASSPKTPITTSTATRDHRGTTGAAEGGVTVDGKKITVGQAPKPGNKKGKDGFAGVGAGATVRDHRK